MRKSLFFKTINIDIKCILDQRAFKGTVVNRKLLSLHGGSLEITLTVIPLNCPVFSSYGL